MSTNHPRPKQTKAPSPPPHLYLPADIYKLLLRCLLPQPRSPDKELPTATSPHLAQHPLPRAEAAPTTWLKTTPCLSARTALSKLLRRRHYGAGAALPLLAAASTASCHFVWPALALPSRWALKWRPARLAVSWLHSGTVQSQL